MSSLPPFPVRPSRAAPRRDFTRVFKRRTMRHFLRISVPSSPNACLKNRKLLLPGMQSKAVLGDACASPHPPALRCESTHQRLKRRRSYPAWRAPLRAPRFRVVAPLAREHRPSGRGSCAMGVAAPRTVQCLWLLPARWRTRAFSTYRYRRLSLARPNRNLDLFSRPRGSLYQA